MGNIRKDVKLSGRERQFRPKSRRYVCANDQGKTCWWKVITSPPDRVLTNLALHLGTIYSTAGMWGRAAAVRERRWTRKTALASGHVFLVFQGL